MMGLVAFMEAVPATVWGFLVGSLVTVIGVALTNASNTKRLRLQHAHERELDARARDLSMRRDVYLAAFEAMATGMTTVGSFGELDIPFQDLMRQYMSKAGAMGKITIVGREETIRAVADFEQALTGAFMRLSGQRNAVDQLFQRTRALETKLEATTQEQERLSSMLERNTGDDGERDQLRRMLAYEQRREAELRSELQAVEAAFHPGMMDLIRTSMQEVAELDTRIVPVVSCVRTELGLPFDDAFYLNLIRSGHAQRAEQFEGFLQASLAAMQGAQDDAGTSDTESPDEVRRTRDA